MQHDGGGQSADAAADDDGLHDDTLLISLGSAAILRPVPGADNLDRPAR
jgi:hypothetical protein